MVRTVSGETDMMEMLTQLREGVAVRAAIGEPVSQDGLTVIPVAKVRGAGGGGGGTGPGAAGEEPGGMGAGMAVTSKPVGVFVLSRGKVGWRPSLDINRMVLGGQIVAVVGLLVLRSILKAKLRPRRRRRLFGL